jgi:hypothetical protein
LLHLITFNDTHTLGWTPLDEGSVCHKDLYLTTHNTQKTDIHTLVGFKTTTPASEWPQTHATGTGNNSTVNKKW